jgi:glutamyl-tRNA(Gln) amidotransferase subunit E
MAVGLSDYKGLLTFPLQPGRDLASEISDRVRVIACLDELPNIIHSEMKDSPLTSAEWRKIASTLESKKNDVIFLVWGDDKDSETAVGEIIIRAREAAEGIPNETRQAFPSGINGFERILPGPDRMYPDTDMPPVPLAEEQIERAKSRLPLTPWQRREYYRKLGLSQEIIKEMVIDERAILFQRAVEAFPIKPTIAAVVLSQMLKHLERKGLPVSRLRDESLLDLLKRYSRGEFAREAFLEILKIMSADSKEPAEAIKSFGIYKLSDDELLGLIQKTIRENKDIQPLDHDKKFRYLMGVLMWNIRGRVSGEKVASFLYKAMKATH